MPKLLNDRVLIKAKPAREVSDGGIHLPSRSKKAADIGTVIAVGPGRPDEGMFVAAGDVVQFELYRATEIQFQGEPHLVVNETDVIMILE